MISTVLYLVLAAAVLYFGHYNFLGVALAAVLAPAWLAGRRHRGERLIGWNAVPELIIGLSVVALIGLTRQPGGQLVFPPETQIALAILYGGFIIWRNRSSQSQPYLIAAASQFSATTAIFLAATYWQWSSLLVVVSLWIASYLVGRWFFETQNESAGAILASSWALIAAQASWVFYLWLVNYGIGRYFIIPQAAIVILGMGYCFINIYSSHISKSLSRRRLIEYLVVAGVLLAIVIAGTRWNVVV